MTAERTPTTAVALARAEARGYLRGEADALAAEAEWRERCRARRWPFVFVLLAGDVGLVNLDMSTAGRSLTEAELARLVATFRRRHQAGSWSADRATTTRPLPRRIAIQLAGEIGRLVGIMPAQFG